MVGFSFWTYPHRESSYNWLGEGPLVTSGETEVDQSSMCVAKREIVSAITVQPPSFVQERSQTPKLNAPEAVPRTMNEPKFASDAPREKIKRVG